MHANEPDPAPELLQDPALQRRNRTVLDRDDTWRLDTGGSDHLDREVTDISVRFAARIPVRPVRLIADGCGLSRAEAERLVTDGKLVSAVRLSTELSGDFTFTLKRWALPGTRACPAAPPDDSSALRTVDAPPAPGSP